MSETESSRKRKTVVRWKNRVKENMHDRRERLNKHEGSVWIGRGGSSSAVAIPLGYIPRGNDISDKIDRM